VPDLGAEADLPRAAVAAGEGLRGAVAFPFRGGGDVLGVVECASVRVQRPDEALLARLTALGTEIGQLVESQRAQEEHRALLTREQTARIQAEALARIGRQLVQSLEPTVVGQQVVDTVCQLLEGWVAVLYAAEPGSDDLVAVARAGPAAARLGDDYRMPAGAGLVGLAVRERRPVVTADLHADPRIWYPPEERARIERAGHRAACAIPLVVKGEVIGALGIGQGPGRVLDEGEVALAGTFADLAALALDNARSFVEEQRLRADAERASRAKDEFLAMLGHELRNPLAAISSAVQVMAAGGPEPGVERAREIIERQAGHLARLVDDLLDVARVTSGRVQLQRAVVDLGRLVEQCVAALSADRRGGPAVEVQAASVPVDADPTRLEQVVTNLLDNAVKYTGPEGRVRVSVAREGETAVLRVVDSGVGIAPDLLPRVFDLFVQADRSLERTRGGLGLGLALVRRLVDLHGGQVEARSAGPGRGSEFVVRLPVAAAAPAPPPGGAPRPRAGRRVLVVEDHEDARESLRLLLAATGHTVEVAASGPEGLERLRAWRPEVALVDVGLPGLDGYQLARAVRTDPSLGPVRLVAVTGYGQPEDRHRAVEAGFDAHLVKPVLLDALQRVLALP
jgi:signal transduction histidine kinase